MCGQLVINFFHIVLLYVIDFLFDVRGLPSDQGVIRLIDLKRRYHPFNYHHILLIHSLLLIRLVLAHMHMISAERCRGRWYAPHEIRFLQECI